MDGFSGRLLFFVAPFSFGPRIAKYSAGSYKNRSDMKQNFEEIYTDVLIIGQGAAGLRTAIELAAGGRTCLMLSKRAYGDAHTKLAAGGINAALANLDQEDTWAIHAADTLREGHFVNNPKAVELLARQVPARVKELQDWGCPFNLSSEGKINQRYFGAQSFRRTCFVGDRTGEAILETLLKKAEEMNIPSRPNTYISSLLKQDNRVVGAIGFDCQDGRYLLFRARAVVLACGGFASIYQRSSSRADENTADNVGLAYEAGASLQDMEFVQFHPTGMIKPEDMRGRLVSEAVRGEGGHLLNKDRERFMEKYSPEKMELDARDVVTRSIYQEIHEGRGTADGGVWLDVSHKEESYIKERLPKLYKRFQEYNIDITREPVEVAPTSHYAMGGIRVAVGTGESTIPGLYAVGEATAGLHGANRLGGNSLAETLVFGQITGAHLLGCLEKMDLPVLQEGLVERKFNEVEDRICRLSPLEPGQQAAFIGKLLWKHAGIVRDREGLEEGLRKLQERDLKKRNAKLSAPTLPDNPFDWVKACNLHFISIAAEAILKVALFREESRGAHYRQDAPDMKDEWKKNIYVQQEGEGMKLMAEDVPPVEEEVQQALDQEYSLDYHHLE